MLLTFGPDQTSNQDGEQHSADQIAIHRESLPVIPGPSAIVRPP